MFGRPWESFSSLLALEIGVDGVANLVASFRGCIRVDRGLKLLGSWPLLQYRSCFYFSAHFILMGSIIITFLSGSWISSEWVIMPLFHERWAVYMIFFMVFSICTSEASKRVTKFSKRRSNYMLFLQILSMEMCLIRCRNLTGYLWKLKYRHMCFQMKLCNCK